MAMGTLLKKQNIQITDYAIPTPKNMTKMENV